MSRHSKGKGRLSSDEYQYYIRMNGHTNPWMSVQQKLMQSLYNEGLRVDATLDSGGVLMVDWFALDIGAGRLVIGRKMARQVNKTI